MFDEPDRAARPQFKPLYIRVDDRHRHSERVADLLGSLGGHRLSRPDGEVYGFLTSPARDGALDLVRLTFGWTVAVPIR